MLRILAAKIYRFVGRRLLHLGVALLGRGGVDARPLEQLPDAPDLMRCYRGWLQDPRLRRRPGGWEYDGRFYPDVLTVGGASAVIRPVAQRYCRGQGIDIGAGLWPFPAAMPIDTWRGDGKNRSLDTVPDQSQDFVFSSHCLEHLADWRPELARWIRKLRPGGILFLYLPHADCGLWIPGSPMVGNEHRWQPTLALVRQELQQLGLDVVADDHGPDGLMSFWVCAKVPDLYRPAPETHQRTSECPPS